MNLFFSHRKCKRWLKGIKTFNPSGPSQEKEKTEKKTFNSRGPHHEEGIWVVLTFATGYLKRCLYCGVPNVPKKLVMGQSTRALQKKNKVWVHPWTNLYESQYWQKGRRALSPFSFEISSFLWRKEEEKLDIGRKKHWYVKKIAKFNKTLEKLVELTLF